VVSGTFAIADCDRGMDPAQLLKQFNITSCPSIRNWLCYVQAPIAIRLRTRWGH